MQQNFGSRRRWIIGLALAAVMGTPHGPARAYTVRAEHPRIWLTPGILASLRAKAAAGSSRWLALKNNCDSSMTSTSDSQVSVMNYGLAYQVTGNTAYADRAIVLMENMIATHQGTAIARNSGFDVRDLLPAVAVGYDWCYDRLTPNQRTQIQAQLEQWADWVWPETNPARVNAYSIDNPMDNYFHGFMMTWLVGLALYGDSPKAPGYVDQALKRWNGLVVPYLQGAAAGGYIPEGTNYGAGTTFRMFWYISAHATATGEDLFHTPGLTWASQAMLAKLYMTTPMLDRVYPGGDQSRVATAPLSDYTRSSALAALSTLDGETAGYTKWWLDHITPDLIQWRWDLWQEFLWYRDDIQGIDYTQTLPLGYLSAGAGWMTSRSDWSRQATQVYMMCGPQLGAHQDLAQNDFMIFHGDWLAAAARLNSHDGLFRETDYHNTLTIGTRGQPEGRPGLPKDKVHVVHFEDTPRYAYFAGQAKDAYAYWQYPNAVPVLNDYYRQLLFLKPNRIVVFDRVDAIDATQVKKWHLHTLNDPTIGADTYQTTVAGTTLFGKSLLPKGALVEKVPLYLASNNGLSSWKVDISAPTGSNLDYFLNVMEVAPAEQSTPAPVLPVQTSRSSLIGAQMGNQIVVFDSASTPTGSITYQMNATAALEHFVLTQLPKAWYGITELSPTGTSLMQERVQSSDHGVLTFPVTAAGTNTIVITSESGSGPAPAPTPTPGTVTPGTTPTPTPAPIPVPAPIPAPTPAPTPGPASTPGSHPAPSPTPAPSPAPPPVPAPTPAPAPSPAPAPNPWTNKPSGTGGAAGGPAAPAPPPMVPPAPALPPAATGAGSPSSTQPFIGPPVPPGGSQPPPSGQAGTPSPSHTSLFIEQRRKWLEHARQRVLPSYWKSTTPG